MAKKATTTAAKLKAKAAQAKATAQKAVEAQIKAVEARYKALSAQLKGSTGPKRPMGEDEMAIVNAVVALKEEVKRVFGFHPLTAAQRKRLVNVGIRIYGFIDKVFDVSETNMQFAPGTFDREEFSRNIHKIEALRNILIAIDQLRDVVMDNLVQAGNDGYRAALIYYSTARDLWRHGDRGAGEVFLTLRPFFANRARRRTAADEPTQKQLLRDVRAVLHGKKDGEIVIENRTPRTLAGKRVVIDDTVKPRGAWRAEEEGVV